MNNYEDYAAIKAYNEKHMIGVEDKSSQIKIDPGELNKAKFVSLHDSSNNRPLWQDYSNTNDA